MRALTAVLALLLVPVALAQTPTAPQPCAIAADAPTAPPALTAPQTLDVTLNVRNTGSLAATITVTGTINDPGWSIETSPEPASVASGAPQAFAFTVRAAEGAAASATLLFSANAACQPATGPLPACPANGCQATAAQQVTLRYEAPSRIGLPLLDQIAFPMEYLVAGVLLVAVATAIPFALRARKPRAGIAADCPEPLKMLKAGRGTSFPIELRNVGDAPAQATFEVAPVPEGWSAFMPLPEVQLAAKESRSLWLMVRAPPEAQPGASADIELRMRMPDGGELPPVRVRAEVNEA